MNNIKKLAATAALSVAVVGLAAPAATASPASSRPAVSHPAAAAPVQLDRTTLFAPQDVLDLLIVVALPMNWEWT